MKIVLTSLVMALGLSGWAWAQDGKEKGKDGKKEKELSIALKDVDTNGDGRASVTEIRVAITKINNAREGRKEGDGGKERKEGERREGERKEGKGVQEPSIVLKDLDTNKDGRATVAELQVALDGLTAKKEGGDKKDGERKEGGDRKK